MKKEYLYAAISIFLWSTTATVTKLLLGNLNSMQVMLVGSFVAFVFLLIVSLVNGCFKELKTYKIIDHIHIFIIGLLGIFLYHLFLYLGIDMMEASQAFIINYLWPMMAVIFACFILKEKMTLKKAVAILLSFVGVIIVTSNGGLLRVEKNTLKGAIYCVLAAASYGLFTVLNKKKTYNKYLSMMLYYFYAFIISLIYVLITRDSFTLSLAQSAGMLWNGIFMTAIPFTTWALALEKGDTAKISNLAYITPFLSLVWTSLILKEKLNPYSILGLVIIVLGILIQIKKEPKNCGSLTGNAQK